MPKIEIEFSQKVTYNAEIEVTDEQYEMLMNADGDSYINMYLRKNKKDRLECNPVYEFLESYANDSYEMEREDRFIDLEVNDVF